MRRVIWIAIALSLGAAMSVLLAALADAAAQYTAEPQPVAIEPRWPRTVPPHWPPPVARSRTSAEGLPGLLRAAHRMRWSGIEEFLQRRQPGEAGTVRLARTMQVDLVRQSAGWPLHTLRWEEFSELDMAFDVVETDVVERRTRRFWRPGPGGEFIETDQPRAVRSVIWPGLAISTAFWTGLILLSGYGAVRLRRTGP